MEFIGVTNAQELRNPKRIWWPDYRQKYSYATWLLAIFFIRAVVFWILNCIILCKVIHIFRRVISQRVVEKDIIIEQKTICPRTCPAVSGFTTPRETIKECPNRKLHQHSYIGMSTIPASTMMVPGFPGSIHRSLAHIPAASWHNSPGPSAPNIHAVNSHTSAKQSLGAIPNVAYQGMNYQRPMYQLRHPTESSTSSLSMDGAPVMQQYQYMQQPAMQVGHQPIYHPMINQPMVNQPMGKQPMANQMTTQQSTDKKYKRPRYDARKASSAVSRKSSDDSFIGNLARRFGITK